MALYTTNPVETVTISEVVASRIPTAALSGPEDGATDVDAATSIVINLGQGQLTLPIVTVNGVIVFRGDAARLGWVALRRAVGEALTLTLKPPGGFAYGSTVAVDVTFEPEAGVNDDGAVILT
jgi:hypothetical protein